MGTPPPATDSPLGDLTRTLWQLRRLLERLQYQLRVQELVVGSGDDDLLRHAVDDVHTSLVAISEVESTRRSLASEIGVSMGLGPDPTLQNLIDRAPAPFDQILTEHLDAYLGLVAEITTTSLNGRDQLERGLRLTQQMVSFVMGDAGDGGYDATGTATAGSTERRLVDRNL